MTNFLTNCLTNGIWCGIVAFMWYGDEVEMTRAILCVTLHLDIFFRYEANRFSFCPLHFFFIFILWIQILKWKRKKFGFWSQNIHGDDSNIKFVWICSCFFFHRCLAYERTHVHISNWIIPYRNTWKNAEISLFCFIIHFLAPLLLITWRAWNTAAIFQMYGWHKARIRKEYERWKLNNKSFEWRA